MFSVTIYRNDTSAESKGKIEFKVKDFSEAHLFALQLRADPPPPMLACHDVDDVLTFIPFSAVAKVEIKEDR